MTISVLVNTQIERFLHKLTKPLHAMWLLGRCTLIIDIAPLRLGSTGWRLPWQMRVAVAEQLTSSLFDPEGNHLRPEAPALQELLLLHVWPVLGINQHDQKALYAWAHFCQAVWGGPVALLQVARATLQELHDNRPLTQGDFQHRKDTPIASLPSPLPSVFYTVGILCYDMCGVRNFGHP